MIKASKATCSHTYCCLYVVQGDYVNSALHVNNNNPTTESSSITLKCDFLLYVNNNNPTTESSSITLKCDFVLVKVNLE